MKNRKGNMGLIIITRNENTRIHLRTFRTNSISYCVESARNESQCVPILGPLTPVSSLVQLRSNVQFYGDLNRAAFAPSLHWNHKNCCGWHQHVLSSPLRAGMRRRSGKENRARIIIKILSSSEPVKSISHTLSQ